jgi:hypothetical protein
MAQGKCGTGVRNHQLRRKLVRGNSLFRQSIQESLHAARALLDLPVCFLDWRELLTARLRYIAHCKYY